MSRANIHDRPAFLLLDVLLGVTVFSFFMGIVGFSVYFVQNMSIRTGDRLRAMHQANRAVEAMRSIRDEDFDTLTAGTHGVQLGDDGKWELTAPPILTSDGFSTTVTLTEVSSNQFTIDADTTWNFGVNRTGSASVITELTNWREVRTLGDWSSISLDGSFIDLAPALFNDAVTITNYAFITSETSGGGAGLYVLDISNPSSPTRVASSFVLPCAGYGLATDGSTLYVSCDSSTGEIRSYDISSPTTLSASDLLDTYNVGGNGRVRTLALFGDSLFAVATHSVSNDELYSFDVADPADILFQDSYDDDAGYLDLSLLNGYAYISSSEDVGELIVADVFDPANILISAGSGYNLTDTPDGTAIQAFGTSALLGRSLGGATEELILFDVGSNPVPTPPPGPWYREIGATVNDIDNEPTGRWAFVATEESTQELQVMDIILFAQGQVPRVDTYDSLNGEGRGVHYDPQTDRVFLMTNSAVLIFEPS